MPGAFGTTSGGQSRPTGYTPGPARVTPAPKPPERLMPWERDDEPAQTGRDAGNNNYRAPQSQAPKPVQQERAEGGRPGGGRGNTPATHNTKVEQPPIALSDPIYQLLNSAGWQTPSRPGTTAASLDVLDMTKATDLAGYDYRVTDAEWQMLQNNLKGQKGYTGNTSLQASALPKISSQVVKAAPMTWEAYNALTDDQRQAVDFNTLLVEARTKDLSAQNPTGAAGNPSDYNAKVTRIFGEGGGSDRIASNVVNLLDKIGFEGNGQDLDEFLSLDRAITMDELADFKFAEGEVTGLVSDTKKTAAKRGVPGTETIESNFTDVRSLENTMRIDTSTVDKAGAFIEGLMTDPNTRLWDFSSTANMGLTGQRPAIGDIPFGYAQLGERTDPLDAKKEEVYQQAYEYMTNRDNPNLDLFWENLNSFKFTDQDVQDLYTMIDNRSRNEEGTGVLDPNVRSGTELRQFAGLGD